MVKYGIPPSLRQVILLHIYIWNSPANRAEYDFDGNIIRIQWDLTSKYGNVMVIQWNITG